MRTVSFASITASLIAALTGCTSLDSTDLNTSGISADMVVSSKVGTAGTHVGVNLYSGTILNVVELAGGDALSVTVDDGSPADLREAQFLGLTAYTTDLDVDAPGTEITVALTRPDEDSAPSSTVSLTDDYTMTGPDEGTAFSRADDDITVSWEGDSVDAMRVDYFGDCVVIDSQDVEAGADSVTFNAASILKRDDDDGEAIADDCDVTFTVYRTRNGTLDPALGGGGIRHELTSTVKITSNP